MLVFRKKFHGITYGRSSLLGKKIHGITVRNDETPMEGIVIQNKKSRAFHRGGTDKKWNGPKETPPPLGKLWILRMKCCPIEFYGKSGLSRKLWIAYESFYQRKAYVRMWLLFHMPMICLLNWALFNGKRPRSLPYSYVKTLIIYVTCIAHFVHWFRVYSLRLILFFLGCREAWTWQSQTYWDFVFHCKLRWVVSVVYIIYT